MQQQQLVKVQMMLDTGRRYADVAERLRTQQELSVQHSEEFEMIKKTIQEKNTIVARLTAQSTTNTALMQQHRTIEQQLLEKKSFVARQRAQLLEIERRLARLEQEEKELLDARQNLVLLEHEALEREEIRGKDTRTRNWLAKQFIPFTTVLERKILYSIHTTFDTAFRQWFSRLLEDDALSTRIDHSFSPVMLQHGYETDVAYLSGGERTSVSLAYRLALVHAIHTLLPHIGTTELLMLDEPTDGFSSEQLERVRDVLRELNMRQIILVSHEQQLEGFVDHILRVCKTEDGSSVEVAA